MYTLTPGYKRVRKKRISISTIITSIAVSLFILSSAVKITLNFRSLYYWDINHLNITSSANMTREDIIKNYNALIDYSVNKSITELKFPTLTMSEDGKLHFIDVKRIFNFIDSMFFITLAISILGIIICLLKRNGLFLKYSSLLLILLPIILAIPFAINFDAVFTAFHKLFFSNDYWEFDPLTDPIINILPQEFFMHCAILILLIMAFSSAIFFICYRSLKNEES